MALMAPRYSLPDNIGVTDVLFHRLPAAVGDLDHCTVVELLLEDLRLLRPSASKSVGFFIGMI